MKIVKGEKLEKIILERQKLEKTDTLNYIVVVLTINSAELELSQYIRHLIPQYNPL